MSAAAEEIAKVRMCQNRNETNVSFHMRLIIDNHSWGPGRLIDLPVRAFTQGLSGGPASQSISFLSGGHQAAIWRLTRALSHGAIQLSGDALVYCEVLPVTQWW